MLGRVMQILKTIKSLLVHYIVMALNWICSLKPISVYQQVTGLMIRIVQAIKPRLRAVILWTTELLFALSRILLEWLIRVGIIIVKLIHTGLGLLHQKTAALLHRLVSNLSTREK